MRVLLLSNYFYPETVGAGIWVTQLAHDLGQSGHRVTVVTSFPSYPEGRIHPAYTGRHHAVETLEGVDVVRTLTYATTSKAFWPRFISFGCFCASSLVGGLAESIKADVVYAVLPPLPLGVSACWLARRAGAPLVVNVQDIYPDVAVATGYLKNSHAIRFFRRMERRIYEVASRIVVISKGFEQNLLTKGVLASKIAVVPNWADAKAIVPGARENEFRHEIGGDGKCLVLYSGGVSLNSDLTSVIGAAQHLRQDPVLFVIVGEGAGKESLVRRAKELALSNVVFLPFQPLERYPEVLSAADITLAALSKAATFASVPSKVYKQMAAARPVVAIAEPESELSRLVGTSKCGVVVPPGNAGAMAAVLRGAIISPGRFEEMGRNGRAYLERECSRTVCVSRLEQIMLEVVNASGRRKKSGEARA